MLTPLILGVLRYWPITIPNKVGSLMGPRHGGVRDREPGLDFHHGRHESAPLYYEPPPIGPIGVRFDADHRS